MSTENKEIEEKIQMFTNLIFHIDDYIRNKKERKGQLNVSKNTRQVLREVISSIVNLKFFINNVIIGSDELEKKSNEEINNQKIYIKTINPLSFNQKNLNNINLFYNTNNEVFIINYLIVDKIFSILRYCLREIIKQKNLDYDHVLGRKDKNFVLNNMKSDELGNDDDTNEENILRKMLKKQYFIEKSRQEKDKIKLSKIKINNLKYKFNTIKNHTVDVSNAINNNYYINNISKNLNKIIIRDDGNSKTNENYLHNQIRRINKVNIPLVKVKNSKTIRTLKNSMSLPLIYDKQILNHKMNSYYTREKKKIINKIKIEDKSKNSKEKNKYLSEKILDYKIFPKFEKTSRKKYYFKSRNISVKE